MLHPHLITLTSLHIYLSHTIADLYDIFKIQLQTSTTSPMTSGASYLLLASLYSGPWYESPSSYHPYIKILTTYITRLYDSRSTSPSTSASLSPMTTSTEWKPKQNLSSEMSQLNSDSGVKEVAISIQPRQKISS